MSNWNEYWETVVINGIVMKGRKIIVPTSLHKKALYQLHKNHMSKGKTRLLAQADLLDNINAHIENTIKVLPCMSSF